MSASDLVTFDHGIPGPRPTVADRRLRVAPGPGPGLAQRHSMGAASEPSCCPACTRRRSRQDAHTLQTAAAPGCRCVRRGRHLHPRDGRVPHRARRPTCDTSRRAVESLSVPVIGSLNGVTPGGWTEYAAMMGDAGAAAIELNPYLVAADPNGHPRRAGAPPRGARRARCAPRWRCRSRSSCRPGGRRWRTWPACWCRPGPSGLVMFNRFVQPDIDLDALAVVDDVHLSSPARSSCSRCGGPPCCADQLDCSLALSGGRARRRCARPRRCSSVRTW